MSGCNICGHHQVLYVGRNGVRLCGRCFDDEYEKGAFDDDE